MGNKKNKDKSSDIKVPTLDNDQLGENASEENARAYAQKGRTTDKKKK